MTAKASWPGKHPHEIARSLSKPLLAALGLDSRLVANWAPDSWQTLSVLSRVDCLTVIFLDSYDTHSTRLVCCSWIFLRQQQKPVASPGSARRSKGNAHFGCEAEELCSTA